MICFTICLSVYQSISLSLPFPCVDTDAIIGSDSNNNEWKSHNIIWRSPLGARAHFCFFCGKKQRHAKIRQHCNGHKKKKLKMCNVVNLLVYNLQSESHGILELTTLLVLLHILERAQPSLSFCQTALVSQLFSVILVILSEFQLHQLYFSVSRFHIQSNRFLMGGIVSKRKAPLERETSVRSNSISVNQTNAKVVSMLAKKKGEVDKSGHTMTFEK
jgi:hypothetical protein